MKNLKYIMGCAAMFAAGFAYSETWTLDPSKLGTTSVEVDLSNTYGDAETDGYWKNSSSVSMRGQGFADGDGEKYTAQFAVNDDGLYVKYVAVPEPAEVAAIFGALVLALAAYRRRK